MIDALTLILGYVVVFNQYQNKYSEKHLFTRIPSIPNIACGPKSTFPI